MPSATSSAYQTLAEPPRYRCAPLAPPYAPGWRHLAIFYVTLSRWMHQAEPCLSGSGDQQVARSSPPRYRINREIELRGDLGDGQAASV